MDTRTKFEIFAASLKDDPEYQFEGLRIDLIEDILEVMERKSISRSALAKKLGCSNAYITKLLSGKQNLTLRTLFDISTVLECTLHITLGKARYASAIEERKTQRLKIGP